MHLAIQCINLVNNIVDDTGLSIPRKAIIQCGLACDVEGIWQREQLYDNLQRIVDAYIDNFNGLDPVAADHPHAN